MPVVTHDMIGEELAIMRGSTWTKRVTWKDAAGVPISLVGYTAKMQLRKKAGAAVIAEFSTEGDAVTVGQIVLGGSAGTIDFLALPAYTETLTAGEYQYDLELYIGDNAYAIIKGVIEIAPNITEEA